MWAAEPGSAEPGLADSHETAAPAEIAFSLRQKLPLEKQEASA